MTTARGWIVLLGLALGCGGSAQPGSTPSPRADPPGSTGSGEPPPDLRTEGPEPEHVLVAHVLISFQGAARTHATRTREAAQKLAREVLARARKGEDFNALIRDLSDDPGPGVYGMANHRVSPQGDEFERRQMATAFGDLGFALRVGGFGMAAYDPEKSPFGWHIIKRLK